jgi:hypothetical protein
LLRQVRHRMVDEPVLEVLAAVREVQTEQVY